MTSTTTTKLFSPKKKIHDDDDDDDDFISIRKRSKVINPPKQNPIDPIKECLESIILQIENNDATCPICNEILSNLNTIDQRQQHVNRCLEESQLNKVNQTKTLKPKYSFLVQIETKHQKSLLSYSKFSSAIRKPPPITSLNFKCQICGMSFNIKRTYLSHLKKCSNQNSVQLKHVVNFAAKTTTINQLKPVIPNKKKTEINIKNRIIKMEIPRTEDDEQQQLVKF